MDRALERLAAALAADWKASPARNVCIHGHLPARALDHEAMYQGMCYINMYTTQTVVHLAYALVEWKAACIDNQDDGW